MHHSFLYWNRCERNRTFVCRILPFCRHYPLLQRQQAKVRTRRYIELERRKKGILQFYLHSDPPVIAFLLLRPLFLYLPTDSAVLARPRKLAGIPSATPAEDALAPANRPAFSSSLLLLRGSRFLTILPPVSRVLSFLYFSCAPSPSLLSLLCRVIVSPFLFHTDSHGRSLSR